MSEILRIAEMSSSGDITWQIERHACVSSTQELVRAAARSGAVQGYCVQAEQQTGGHGRHGREWVSPQGNLYTSFLLRPSCDPSQLGQVALVVGIALAQTIAELSDHKPLLKWPNDVLVEGHDGLKKCAGILIESEMDASGAVGGVIVGAGVNFTSAPDYAVALGEQNLSKFLSVFLEYMTQSYKLWQEQGFEATRQRWLDYALPFSTPMSVKIGADIQEGQFRGIDDQGALLLDQGNGAITTITSGDVFV